MGCSPEQFHLTFDKKISAAPFTGRVLVVASKGEIKDLPPRTSWFNPEPFFAWDVKDWKPGEMLVLRGETAIAFPEQLAKLATRDYSLQAVLDLVRPRTFENADALDALIAEGEGDA